MEDATKKDAPSVPGLKVPDHWIAHLGLQVCKTKSYIKHYRCATCLLKLLSRVQMNQKYNAKVNKGKGAVSH